MVTLQSTGASLSQLFVHAFEKDITHMDHIEYMSNSEEEDGDDDMDKVTFVSNSATLSL